LCLLASGNAMEGIMRTGRSILFSVILALGAAGTILATSPAIASASTQVPAAHVHHVMSVGPDVYYHA
jgi:hypothetical protein